MSEANRQDCSHCFHSSCICSEEELEILRQQDDLFNYLNR